MNKLFTIFALAALFASASAEICALQTGINKCMACDTHNGIDCNSCETGYFLDS